MDKNWDIQLINCTVGYGENVVLDDITATLPAGRISVILGGSGCGKSTLLRHIVGLARPISGRIIVGGRDIFAIPEKTFRRIRRRMGVLFQDGALLGSLTVAENVGLPLREHTTLPQSVVDEAALHRLSMVGLEGFGGYYPTELSGGMRKRAGLARALVTDPPILLCDEPTSGLDPISAVQMDRLLLDMKNNFPDMTIVVVSHDLASVATIADHVLVLHDRHLLFSGSKEALYASNNPYLRQFLERKPAEETAHAQQQELSEHSRKAVREALDSWFDRG